MLLNKFIKKTGLYFIFLKKVFQKPEKWKIFWKQLFSEADKLVISSTLIVGIISLFIGGVLVIQTASNLLNPLIDKMYVGYLVRESLILEFCSTMIGLILAGKIGSRISSELGSMRISDQIDAMDMMGVNSAGFLVLPKILSTTLLSPFLMLLSLFLGILGGYLVVFFTGVISIDQYTRGLLYWYNSYYVFYAGVKTAVFCFIVSSISSFYGYYAEGGSIGVGHNSTKAIIYSSILILVFDLILTHLMLY